MDLSIKSATAEDKEIIFFLLQPYLKELSRYPNEQADYEDEKGIYCYPYLDAYWQEDGRYPYLLLSDRKIAGFALVRRDSQHWEMAEFYVLPEMRRRGFATSFAVQILLKHPGGWRIECNNANAAGNALWSKLARYFSKNQMITGKTIAGRNIIRFNVF